MSELIVKVGADTTDLKEALKDVENQTSNFGTSLKAIGAAVSFGAIVSTVRSLGEAYGEAEQASIKLTTSLQNQGIYTKELQDEYEALATKLQAKTGADDDAIKSGLALLQSFAGQTKISEETTKAVLDLAAAQGMDLEQAFSLVAKSVGSNTNALGRYGIEVDSNASKSEKMAQIVESINGKYKDQSIILGQSLNGQLKITSALFSDLQEELGKKFAPIILKVNASFKTMVEFIQNNDWILTLIRDLTIAGGIISGLVTSVYALNVAMKVLSATNPLLLALAAVTAAVTLLVMNWDSALKFITALTRSFVSTISTLFGIVSETFSNIWTEGFSIEKIQKAIDDATSTFAAGFEAFKAERNALQEQDAAEQAAKDAAADADKQNRNNKNKEEQSKYEKDVSDSVKKMRESEYQAQVQNNARMIFEQQKFGALYAMINRAMHSSIYQGSKQAFGELAALQESSNSTLKAIGKTAAVANIIIRTAESAMNIYAGFSTIPFIGPALGIAGAAAAIAFGGEQIGKVTAAAQGGLMTGGVPGVDSIPVMAQQGELIAPAQNFEEVVGSVAASRAAQDSGFMASGEALAVLMDIRERVGPQVVVQGDFYGEQAFLDRLMERISDRVEFGNGRLVSSGSA